MKSLTTVLTLSMLWIASGLVHGEITGSVGLTRSTIEAGSSAQLRITIEGTTNVEAPPPPVVEGLDMQFTGRSIQQRIINFERSVTTVVTYQIRGNLPGKYTIPSITIVADGKPYKTPERELEVVEQKIASPRRADQQMYFAEIDVPKSEAYVGELVPVDIRFFYNRRINFQPEQPPVLSGEGYTSQKLAEPSVEQEVRNGEIYNVITYRTAIAGVRPGKIDLGPITQQVLIRIPTQRRAQSLFDQFFGDDPFGRSSPFGGALTETRRETVSTDSIEMTIKPLPTENQPDVFQGAVGEFSLSSSVQPREGEAGDPISVTFQIGGQGNFDRVGAPVIAESDIWREYDANEEFTAQDELGMRGTKTFEIVMVPNQATSSLPSAKFAYFDPRQEKYIVREAPPFPVSIRERPGGPIATPTPRQTQEPTDSEPTPTPELANDSNEILHVMMEPGRLVGPFRSVIEQPAFVAAGTVPGVLLLGLFIFGGVRRSRERNREAIALRKERQKWLHTLRSAKDEQSGSEAFHRLLALDLQPGAFESVEEVLQRDSRLTPEEIERACRIVQTHERLQYTPGDDGATWSQESRDFCLAVLQKLSAKKAASPRSLEAV